MKVKTFKQKFEKLRGDIEQILTKIDNLADEIEDDDDTIDIVHEITANTSLIIVENTDERPSKVNLATYEEHLEQLEEENEMYD